MAVMLILVGSITTINTIVIAAIEARNIKHEKPSLLVTFFDIVHRKLDAGKAETQVRIGWIAALVFVAPWIFNLIDGMSKQSEGRRLLFHMGEGSRVGTFFLLHLFVIAPLVIYAISLARERLKATLISFRVWWGIWLLVFIIGLITTQWFNLSNLQVLLNALPLLCFAVGAILLWIGVYGLKRIASV